MTAEMKYHALLKGEKREGLGVFGKILRTIGFVAVLAASVFLLFANLILLDLDFLDDILMTVGQILNNVDFLGEYVLLMFVGGFLLLLWTTAKRKGLAVVATLLVLVGVYVNDLTSLMPVIPFFDLPQLDFVIDLLMDFEYGVLIALVVPIVFLIIALRPRKKKRSLNVIKVGLWLIILALVLTALPQLIPDVATLSFYLTVVFSVFSLALVFVLLGSVLGIIGFARK